MAECPDEDTLVALAHGALAGAARDGALAHVDGCEACRKTVAALAADAPPAGGAAKIGRYELIEPIGAGAMGIVFAAHDPELDRKIAVKLLRRDRGDDSDRRLAQRLIGEARSLARLAHPNVIAAYEVGRHDGDVFLAMELVTGDTLTRWLVAAPRTRREIVAAFLQAGEGLAAAHDAGIVHRDFKPDNVLVGVDGRVRVTDFGLASGGLGGSSPATVVGEVALTRTGALAGTPAYMAPEQLDGAPASARSDQFAFAVALWTALYGVRPFAGDSVPTLVEAARAGRPRTTAGRDVSARLRAILTRALAADPEARWPDVRALLRALAPFAQPARTQNLIVGAAVLIAVLGGGVALGLSRGGGGGPVCDADVAAGLWDEPQRAAVRDAFAVAGPTRAEPVTASVDAALGRFRDAWGAAHVEACTLGAAGAARRACLDLQRVQADALVRLFGAADPAIVDGAVAAVAALPDPGACVRAGVQPPAAVDPAAQALVVRLEEIKALRITGLVARAYDGADAVMREATAQGFEAVSTAALIERAHAAEWTGRLDEALADYRVATERALVARDDELLARALVGNTYGFVRGGHNAEAALTASLARAVFARMGGAPEHDAALAVALCMRAWRLGKELDAGRAGCEDARRKLIALGGDDDFRLWELSNETGNVAYLQGRYEDAMRHYRDAIERSARLNGPAHPRVDAALGNLAETLVRLGRGAEAIPEYETLLARQPDSPAFHDGLAMARRQVGDHAGALASHQAAARNAARVGLVQDHCWGEVGAAEDLIALARWPDVGAAIAAAQEPCDRAGTPLERARVAFARARLRAHTGDARGARDAADAALALTAEVGDAAGPAAQLRAEIAAWLAR